MSSEGAKNNVFVLLGAPGSGKGTVSAMCIENFGWKQLSTGNLCRKHIAEQTEIGKQIDFVLKSGKLVSDSIIIDMVNQWLSEQLSLGKTVLLDGYPRNSVQAKALDDFLQEDTHKQVGFAVVKLEVPDDVVVGRLSNRRVCQNKSCQAVYSVAENSGCKPKHDMVCDKCGTALEIRNDDKPEVVAERLRVYREHERALLDFYKAQGQNIITISAGRPLGEVFDSFKKKVGLED